MLKCSKTAQWRILVPSASVPPSTGTPGLWRRKSGTGAVDAQGLGLTHPMTWIDERLFGWSRSAKRGTSAWGGFSGDEGSRLATPDETDDEDSGDYDNVVGIIPTGDDQLNPAQKSQKSRSRQSSYADLQRLRLSPLPPPLDTAQRSESRGLSTAVSSTETETGMNLRQGHRTRRESLSDGVPVARIAAVDRGERFASATQDLNHEIDRQRMHQTAT
jgi:glycerol-3-phosphate O-acyltransferase / dihydroxyacetone phosphate acyltransferase